MPGACGIRNAFGMFHRNADLALVKPGLVELGDGFVCMEAVFEDADDGGTLLSIHGCFTVQSLFLKGIVIELCANIKY